MTTNARKLKELLGAEASVTSVTYQGRKYTVTQGTGEANFGSEGGGGAAFAYSVRDLSSKHLHPEGWDYSEWCNSVSTVEDVGLARKLARHHGLRLARSGSCLPVLSDAEFVRVTRRR